MEKIDLASVEKKSFELATEKISKTEDMTIDKAKRHIEIMELSMGDNDAYDAVAKGNIRAYQLFITEQEPKIEQQKEEARKKQPVYYIANGGGCDCFDYYGWDTEVKELRTAFVDWDSGRGAEMMPDWDNNDICNMPKSCEKDFKEFCAKYFSEKYGAVAGFFEDYKGKMKVPCRVTTGRKFKGEGILTHFTEKKYRDYSGYLHISTTAHIVDDYGVEQTAVATRVEISHDVQQRVIRKGIMNMSLADLKDLFYGILWHFGRYQSDTYPKIIKAAFKDLNEE